MECLGGKGNVAVLSRRWAILVKHFFDEQVKNIEQIFQTKFFLKKAAKFEKKKNFSRAAVRIEVVIVSIS
jgi:hypothetical protein